MTFVETYHDQEASMSSILTSIRMPPELLKDLKALARQESVRRGESVSWAELVREGARRTLQQKKKRARGS
jgi:Arc/MetJ-type ribon-helix-helix transcriptional regulator